MKPKVAFFDFSSCEGCQLEVINLDGPEVVDLLNAVDIVNFREAKTEREDDYDIAFVEGSITRESEIPRIQKIRKQANYDRRQPHQRIDYANQETFSREVIERYCCSSRNT